MNDLDDVADALDGNYRLAKRVLRRAVDVVGQRPIYVVVQSVSRHWGGPEEGGWWFDWTTTEAVCRVWTWKGCRDVIRSLRAEYPAPRYGIGSCANRGECEYTIGLYSSESEFPSETTERPSYC